MGSRNPADWDRAYEGEPPAWEIGRPQPAFVELAEQGLLAGKVLDVGCGTGEQAVLAAQHGAEVVGVDLSPRAVAIARAKARDRGVWASFVAADALELEKLNETFDVVLDSGLFHGWDEEQRPLYAQSLGRVMRPGGVLYLSCISDHQPGDWGPRRISERQIRETFDKGWKVEELRLCDRMIRRPEVQVWSAKAWLAVIRRLPARTEAQVSGLVPPPQRWADRLARQFRTQAERAVAAGRSPLFAALLAGAADDLESDGVVAEAFGGVEPAAASGPGMRLFAALHSLVLSGSAPELAGYFAVGSPAAPGAAVWATAEAAIQSHLPEVRRLLQLATQTNEPGRAAALFGALLLLVNEHPLPVRLLELGASAGLNLNADRFHYETQGASLGDPSSPVRFVEPWRGRPVDDPIATQRSLSIVQRCGCDLDPIDPTADEGRLRLQSHIWPDEPERMERLLAAVEVARRWPPQVERAPADSWLAKQFAHPSCGAFTVVWQSVVDPYLSDEQRIDLEAVVAAGAAAATAERPLAVVRLEAEEAVISGLKLQARLWPDGTERTLARCRSDGPPVTWQTDTTVPIS